MPVIAGSATWNTWIDEARQANILTVAQTLGAQLKRAGSAEWVGPCPVCGGTDRFALNTQKAVFNCRMCGEKGDGIHLVEYVTGCSFLEAIERITARQRPDRTRDETLDESNLRLKRNAERIAQLRQREEEQRRIDEARAKREEEAVHKVLERAVPIEGTHAWEYLKHERKLCPPRRLTLDLKFVAELDYWGAQDNGTGAIVHLATLPALVAIIRDFSGAIIGISQTYLDAKEPRKWKPVGSARNSAKKIRGTKKNGSIRLGAVTSDTMAIGEGWENVLAWWQMGQGPEDISLAAAVDLHNLAGSATGTVPHPGLKDADGRPKQMKNSLPDPKRPGVIVPDDITSIIILADLDSETFATAAEIATAGNRFVAQGKRVEIAWPDVGADWNDVLIRETGE